MNEQDVKETTELVVELKDKIDEATKQFKRLGITLSIIILTQVLLVLWVILK